MKNRMTLLAAALVCAINSGCSGSPTQDSVAVNSSATASVSASAVATATAKATASAPESTAPTASESTAATSVATAATPAALTVAATPAAVAVGGAAASASASVAGWPQWGRNGHKNLYSPAKGLPASFAPGDFKPNSEEIDMSTTKNVAQVLKLGSSAYGNVAVAGGKIFIGTNNETPRDSRHLGDRGNLYCFDEKTGDYLWQLACPKLGAGKVSDWEFLGICSSPAIEGNRIYVVGNRCEIICLDTEGMKDGNQGDQDEGKFMAGPGKPPMEVFEKDADIIWRYDMRGELGVFPHNVASSSIVIVGDALFCTTSNGQDWSHLNIPSPTAPCLIALDKKTGELIGEEAEGISKNIMHCNWSSPSFAEVNGKGMVFFAGGDGVLYAFDPKPKKDDEGYGILQKIWSYDCVPDKYKKDKGGKVIKYPDADGPSELIATPVFYKNRVYVAIGQDPEHGEGVGNLVCVDATNGKRVWNYDKINRTISTASIDPTTGLLFIADYSGFVYCIDADTGKENWIYDTKAHMWSSTLVGDGKLYIGDEDGDVTILPARADFDPKKDKPILDVNLQAPIYSSPIFANGRLYIASQSHLYVIGK